MFWHSAAHLLDGAGAGGLSRDEHMHPVALDCQPQGASRCRQLPPLELVLAGRCGCSPPTCRSVLFVVGCAQDLGLSIRNMKILRDIKSSCVGSKALGPLVPPH